MQVTAGRSRARLPVLRRAVAGTCSRAGLPIDRIDDAILILEALLADTRVARSDEVHLVLTARPGSFSLLMGPLPDGEAERLIVSAGLPTIGPVVDQLASAALLVDDGRCMLVVVDAV